MYSEQNLETLGPPSGESYLFPGHFDLVTPDAAITKLTRLSKTTAEAELFIHNISPSFVGFDLDDDSTYFNIKSVVAQLGLDGEAIELSLDRKSCCAHARIKLRAIGSIAIALLDIIPVGAHIGKFFAADDRRRVRDPDYLSRMFGRSDSHGRPLLSLGGMHGSNDLILDKVDGRTIAYLSLQNGRVEYDERIFGLLPTLAKALCADMSMRELIRLHQDWVAHAPRNVEVGDLLLVRTLPLHIRTVFGRVVPELLASGYYHTSASILQPDTYASGDIYELFGDSKREITDIPIEFYTLEPHREHVFFQDRDQLQTCIEEQKVLFDAFDTAPNPEENGASVFVVKGDQLLNLKESDWITRESRQHEFPGPDHPSRHGLMVERYIQSQASFPFLHAIEEELITSQGILLTRYLSTPLMKRMFLSNMVQRCLKGIYFERPSRSGDDFFSHEDRFLFHDLFQVAVPIFWVDRITGNVLQYTERTNTGGAGMFVPLDKVETFLNATIFGVYGSNLLEGDFEQELKKLLCGVLEMRPKMSHPLCNPETPFALVTGGGPGAMEVGNRVAQDLDILSCGYIVDFRAKDDTFVNEQLQNPHVEAKMTYRLDKLVERQAEFNLDFPIFLTGGIGTDFEYSLEEVRRKVGHHATPVILFGSAEYWKEKITSRFQCNKKAGTIKGSEWISNSFFAVTSAEQGVKIFKQYFEGTLPIGKDYPGNELGFVPVE